MKSNPSCNFFVLILSFATEGFRGIQARAWAEELRGLLSPCVYDTRFYSHTDSTKLRHWIRLILARLCGISRTSCGSAVAPNPTQGPENAFDISSGALRIVHFQTSKMHMSGIWYSQITEGSILPTSAYIKLLNYYADC